MDTLLMLFVLLMTNSLWAGLFLTPEWFLITAFSGIGAAVTVAYYSLNKK